jgi:hypothetical protein
MVKFTFEEASVSRTLRRAGWCQRDRFGTVKPLTSRKDVRVQTRDFVS